MYSNKCRPVSYTVDDYTIYYNGSVNAIEERRHETIINRKSVKTGHIFIVSYCTRERDWLISKTESKREYIVLNKYFEVYRICSI